MTIGDVLAAVAALLTLGASWGAAILLAALAFPKRATRAQSLLMEHPWACLGRGAAGLLVVGLPTLALAHTPGPARLLLLLPLGLLAAGAMVGSAAAVRLLGGRIDAIGSPLTPFAALTRATFLYVSAGFLPVIGWLLVLPGSLLLALGAGLPALFPERAPAPRVAATPLEAAP